MAAFWCKAHQALEKLIPSAILSAICWPRARAFSSRAIRQKRCAWCAIISFPSCVRCVSACSKVTWTAARSSRLPWDRLRKGYHNQTHGTHELFAAVQVTFEHADTQRTQLTARE